MLESIGLEKYNSSTGKKSTHYFDIVEFKSSSEGGTMYIVLEGEMGIGGPKSSEQCPYLEIYKVLFIGSFIISSKELNKTFDVIAAVYTDNNGDLIAHVIGGLRGIDPHFAPISTGALIDYEGYRKSCDYTGEHILPFLEYYNTKREGIYGPSTILFKDDKTYNFQQQTVLYEQSK